MLIYQTRVKRKGGSMKVIRLLLLCVVLIAETVFARFNMPDKRLTYDFYYNKSTLTWDTEKYDKFKAPVNFYSVDMARITNGYYLVWDLNGLVRAVGLGDDKYEADDDIHTIEFFRYLRIRGSFALAPFASGKLMLAYNLFDWYKADANNVEKDEFRSAGVGVGVGVAHLLRTRSLTSHVAFCYNWGFNGDAKKINDSSLADKYTTLEADFWYWLSRSFGLCAKIHYENHDFKQITIKNVYPTEGPGKLKVMTYRLGISLAIARDDW